jgi:hypothetical protein
MRKIPTFNIDLWNALRNIRVRIINKPSSYLYPFHSVDFILVATPWSSNALRQGLDLTAETYPSSQLGYTHQRASIVILINYPSV